MVPDLVCDDVCLRKVAGRSEAIRQQPVEVEINVDVAVAGAIERTNSCLGGAAGGLNGAGEEDQLGLIVVAAAPGKQVAPGVFGIGEDDRNEILEPVLRRMRGAACCCTPPPNCPAP